MGIRERLRNILQVKCVSNPSSYISFSVIHRSGYRRQRVSVAGRDVTTWGAPFGGMLRSRDSSWEMRTMDDGFDLLKQGEVVDGVFLLLFKV